MCGWIGRGVCGGGRVGVWVDRERCVGGRGVGEWGDVWVGGVWVSGEMWGWGGVGGCGEVWVPSLPLCVCICVFTVCAGIGPRPSCFPLW